MAVTDATIAEADSPGNQLRDRIRSQTDQLYHEGIGFGEDGYSANLFPASLTPGRGAWCPELELVS